MNIQSDRVFKTQWSIEKQYHSVIKQTEQSPDAAQFRICAEHETPHLPFAGTTLKRRVWDVTDTCIINVAAVDWTQHLAAVASQSVLTWAVEVVQFFETQQRFEPACDPYWNLRDEIFFLLLNTLHHTYIYSNAVVFRSRARQYIF